MAKLIYSSGPGLAKSKQKMPTFDTSTPEGAFSQGIAIKKRDFQRHYNLERDTIIRRGRAKKLDNRQINQYLDQLNTNADRKALELKQEEEIGLIKIRGKGPSVLERQFQEVTKLEAGGTMSPEQATEARTRMKIGPTAASVLYRKEDDPQDPMAQFGKLDIYRNRLESRIEKFRFSPAEKGSWGWREDTPGKGITLEILEPTLMGRDKKGVTTGNWRKATMGEIQEYGALTKEQKRVTAAQRPMMSGIMSTAINSPRIGGSIQDQAKKYIENRQTQQEPEQRETAQTDEQSKYAELIKRGWTPEQIRQALEQ